MKAIVCKKYGIENCTLEDAEKPSPKDDEVLVEVHASSVNTDCVIPVSGKPLFMKELIETGKVRPVIDRSFPLCEAGKALSYYGNCHPKGKVVISVR
jgi:NADPH:quinone reductase-like Zn-dependent oxidoreductase